MAMTQPNFSINQEVLAFAELEHGTFTDEGIVIGMVWNPDFSRVADTWWYWIEYTKLNSSENQQLPQFGWYLEEELKAKVNKVVNTRNNVMKTY
ncbi:MAG TPA: hypothetical protein V6C65_06735 [Allocoleopsis sp.]